MQGVNAMNNIYGYTSGLIMCSSYLARNSFMLYVCSTHLGNFEIGKQFSSSPKCVVHTPKHTNPSYSRAPVLIQIFFRTDTLNPSSNLTLFSHRWAQVPVMRPWPPRRPRRGKRNRGSYEDYDGGR